LVLKRYSSSFYTDDLRSATRVLFSVAERHPTWWRVFAIWMVAEFLLLLTIMFKAAIEG